MFQEFYQSQFIEIFGSPPGPADGLSEETVQATLAERGLHVPAALFDYYAVAGFHWINTKQNQLRPIDELDWYQDWLVFMDDNQGLVSWGIHKHDLSSPDPIIWQGIVGEEIDWFQEHSTLSRFLMDMWRETAAGEGKNCGNCTIARRICVRGKHMELNPLPQNGGFSYNIQGNE